MRTRVLAVGLIFTWALALTGCDNSSTTSNASPSTAQGTLITLIGDSPVCDVLAFRPTITKLALTPQSGSDIAVFLQTATFSPAIKVNLAGLRDSRTVLNLARVPAGTYVATTVTFSGAQLVVLDTTQSPPIPRAVTVALTTPAPKVPIQPPLTIPAPVNGQTKLGVLTLDFDLLQSVGVDANSQVTGTVTPTLRATAPTASGPLGFGAIDQIRGFVTRVDTTAASPFTSDVQVQLLEGSAGAPLILASLLSTSQLLGVSDLNRLLTGSFVEFDGFIDAGGNFVASMLDVHDSENTSNNKLAFIGYVLSLTKDANGNLTQFNFYVHEEHPNPGFGVTDDTVVAVNVSNISPSGYRFSSPATNFASLPFSPAAIVPGQELIVHGTFTVPPNATPQVNADKIDLKLQAVQGTFSSLLQAGPDDRTGAFAFTPCASLLRGTPVIVVTNGQTTFLNVSGLSALTPQPSLLVRGLPFFEPQTTTVNGVSVRAGTLVILAKQVHQLS